MKTLALTSTLFFATLLTFATNKENVPSNKIVVDNEIIVMDQGGMAMDDLTNYGDFSSNGNELVAITEPVKNPENGTIDIQADGTYMYFPNEEFVGKDTISVKVCDAKDANNCVTNHLFVTVEAPRTASQQQMQQIIAVSNKK